MVKHYLLIFLITYVITFSILFTLKPTFIMKTNISTMNVEIDYVRLIFLSVAIGLLTTTKWFILMILFPGIP